MLLRVLTLAQHACIAGCLVALMVVLAHWHSSSEAARLRLLSQKAAARGSSVFESHLLGAIGEPVRLSNAMRLKEWSAAVPAYDANANPFLDGSSASRRAWTMLRRIARSGGLQDAYEVERLNNTIYSVNATHDALRMTWRVHGCNQDLVCVCWLADATVEGRRTTNATSTIAAAVVVRAAVNATWWNATSIGGGRIDGYEGDVVVTPLPEALVNNNNFHSTVPLGMCPSMFDSVWQAVVAAAASSRNITAVVEPMTTSDEFAHSVLVGVGGDSAQNLSASGAFIAVLDAALGCDGALTTPNASTLLSASSLSTFGGGDAAQNVTSAVVSIVNTTDVVASLAPPISDDILPPTVVGVLLGSDLLALSPPSSPPTWLTSDEAKDVIESFFVQRTGADGHRLVISEMEFRVGFQTFRVVCLSERTPFTTYAAPLFQLFCITGVVCFVLVAASILLQLCLLVWPMEAIGRLIEDAPHGVLMDMLLRVRRKALEATAATNDDEEVDDGRSLFASALPEDRDTPLKWSFPIIGFLRSWEDAVAPLASLKEADDDQLLLSHKLVCLSVSGCILNEMGGMMVGLLTLYYRLQYAKKFIPEGVLLDVDDDDAMLFGDIAGAQQFDPDETTAARAFVASYDARPPDEMLPSHVRTNSPNDEATMFGLVGSENPSTQETLSLGWSVSHSFGHSLHLGMHAPALGGTPTSRRGGGGAKVNQFQWVVCTALHITLPHPAQYHGHQDDLSEFTQLFLDVSIQAVAEMGGRIDTLQPNSIVAYFGSLRSADHQGPSVAEHKNPLSAVPSSMARLDHLASYHPVDQRKSPVRAAVCAFMIRNQLRSVSGRARRFQAYASENVSFLLDKGTFLYGDCGNKDRLNRVVFLPEYQRTSESILGLNRHVLGAQFVATTRAARVVEGSLRRAKILNRIASVLPIDCVEMKSDASRFAAPSDPCGDMEVASVGSSLNSSQHMHFEGGGRNKNTGAAVPSIVWLFLIVELETPHADAACTTEPHSLRQQPMLSLSYSERVASVFHMYQMFNNAVRVGLVPDSRASPANTDASGTLTEPAKHPNGRRVVNIASCSLRDVQRVLHHLTAVAELAPLVTHLMTALEGWSAAASNTLPMQQRGEEPKQPDACVHRAPDPPVRMRYARKQLVGWQLFGFVSLEEQHRANVAVHAKQLREYEAAASGGMRTVLANRRMQQQKQQLLVLPTMGMMPIPAAFNFAGPTASDAAEQRTEGDWGDPHGATATANTAAPFSLFDVLMPTMPDPRLLIDTTAHATSTPHTSSSDASQRHHPAATGSKASHPFHSHSSTAPMMTEGNDPNEDGNGDPSMDGPLPGELPSVIRDNNNTYWERSNEVLGQGAFSAVYSGLSNDGAVVALKCVSLRARHVVERDLEQEVNTACGLSHNNICKYYGWVLLDAYLIVVMEYVSGGSLHAMIRQHPGGLPRSVCVTYATGCLQGLCYLHHLGIVHCDVKPHNVLVSDDGVVKLTDFGSIVSEAKHGAPQGDDLRGTVLYMAPEIMRGEKPSAASDVFSFGLLWYEMLTGGELPWTVVQPPPGASDTGSSTCDDAEQDTLQDIAASPPRFMNLVNSGVVGIRIPRHCIEWAPRMMAVIARCLDADPALRPTCNALLKESMCDIAEDAR